MKSGACWKRQLQTKMHTGGRESESHDTQSVSQVLTVWMNPKTAEVALGHSPFAYITKKGKDDPFHRYAILFIND